MLNGQVQKIISWLMGIISCWMGKLRELFPSLAQESQKGRHIRSVLVLRHCRSLPLVQEPNPRLGSSSSHLERQVIEIISCWMGKLRELFSKYKKNSIVISVEYMLNYWKGWLREIYIQNVIIVIQSDWWINWSAIR